MYVWLKDFIIFPANVLRVRFDHILKSGQER